MGNRDDMPLTDKARAWVAAGNTTGPGTYVCGRCSGDKEPSRINSRLCRACAGTGDKQEFRETDVSALIERLDKQAAAIRDLRKRVRFLETGESGSR